MKRKPGFDDEFLPKRQRWSWPVRSIGRLMIVVAILGAALSVMAGMGKQKKNVRYYYPARVQQRPQAPQVKVGVVQPRDPFVIVAAARIDAEMVVPAPAGDEAMVFNPYTRERLSAQAAPATGSPLMPVPETQPGQLPDGYFAPQGIPQLPAPAQPR